MGRVRQKVARLAGTVFCFQGLFGISSIATPLYLRSSGFSIANIALFNSLVAIPWFFKIIYGIISDTYPISGYRRKPYLMISAVLSCIGWISMAVLPDQFVPLVVGMMIANLGFAMTDVVTDGVVVEHSDATNAQVYQSISWGMRSLGSVISGVLGGYLVTLVNFRIVFMMAACLPIVIGLSAFYYEEEKRTTLPTSGAFSSVAKSFSHLMSGDLRWFCILLLIFSFSSSFMVPLFFHMKENLNFNERFLGWLGSMTWLGAMIGCFLYLKFFKTVPLEKALRMAIGLGFIEILCCLFIHDKPTAILMSVMAGALGYMSLVPIMSSAAKLAHRSGVESSLFAILMSIFNVGQALSTFAGGWLNERIGIQPLIVLTAFFVLSSILVVKKLKNL